MKMLKRIYYHYEELEEFEAGLWRNQVLGEERKKYMEASATLMKDSLEFEKAMRRALEHWPKSCQHNLTSEASNRIAYLGHAGCCIACGSPEGATRQAWHTLNSKEQDVANATAFRVLLDWENKDSDNATLFRWADAQAAHRN